MLDTSHCKPYFDHVVAEAKRLGLYEPVMPDPKLDDRWLKQSDVTEQAKVMLVDNGCIAYALWTPGAAVSPPYGLPDPGARWEPGLHLSTINDFKKNWLLRGWHADAGNIQYLKKSLDFLDSYAEGVSDEAEAEKLRRDLAETYNRPMEQRGIGTKRVFGRTTCILTKDFSPLSFTFAIYRNLTMQESVSSGKSGTRVHIISGGLIFQGKHEGGNVDSTTTLSVALEPYSGWSINT